MVPIWTILSYVKPRFQGHDITQRQISQKRYKIELHLQQRTNRKSYYYGLSNGTILNDLEQHLTQFSRSHYSFPLNVS